MDEVWEDIKGYEGYYQVSNLGNFRSKDRIVKYKNNGFRLYPGKSLLVEETPDGYKRILFMKDGIKERFMCHRLVAQEFIPNIENKPYVNHIDGNKGNNVITNLEWCTQSENERHSVDVLGKTMKNKVHPKKVKCVENDIIFDSMNKAVKYIGGSACIEGLKKSINANRKYHNLTFKYIN